jgi:hypothetical protein
VVITAGMHGKEPDRDLPQAPLRPDHPLHPTSTRIVTADPPYPSALLLRGEPGVNSYQPHPQFVPGQHFDFAGAQAAAQRDDR